MRSLFFVFAGCRYYPCGGPGDCIGVFDTLEAAVECWNGRTDFHWGGIGIVKPCADKPGAYEWEFLAGYGD